MGREPAAWNRPDKPHRPGPRLPAGAGSVRGRRRGQVGFVDEFELPSRHDGEKVGRPDRAVTQDGRLKSERGSHRVGQREHYLDLDRHHHPGMDVDLVCVTPPMPLPAPADIPERTRYAHLDWRPLAALVDETWKDTAEVTETTLAESAVRYLAGSTNLDLQPPTAKKTVVPLPAKEPAALFQRRSKAPRLRSQDRWNRTGSSGPFPSTRLTPQTWKSSDS